MLSISTTPPTASTPSIVQPQIVSAALTDRGRRRTANEDRFGVYPEHGLYLVADGMGGAAGGAIAARMAVNLVLDAFAGSAKPFHRDTARAGLDYLVQAIQQANASIHSVRNAFTKYQGMGTTIAALLACGDRAVLVHVGDSRIYRLRGERLVPLTEDHSLYNDHVRAGLADPNRPQDFKYHHVISRALGSGPTVDVEARLVEALPGDTFLLCSDGLHGTVRHQYLTEILAAYADLDEAAKRLIKEANDKGGPDNITAVLVRWEPATTAVRAAL